MVDKWERAGAATGIVAVLCFVIGVLVLEPGEFLEITAAPEEVAAYFTDHSRVLGAQAFVLTWGFLALLWFSGSMRRALLAAEPPPGRLSSVAFGAGVVTAGMFLLGSVTFAAGLGVDHDAMDPAALHALAVVHEVGFAPILAGFLGLAVFIAASSLVAIRFGGLPRWLAWAGLVLFAATFVGSLMLLNPHPDNPLGGVMWVTFLASMLWVLVASILLTMKPVRVVVVPDESAQRDSDSPTSSATP